MIPILLAAGAEPNTAERRGLTVLHIAATLLTLPDYLAHYMSAGASIDLLSNSGDTPLLSLVKYGASFAEFDLATENVRLLLEAGANIDQQDEDGHSPLHLSVANGIPLLTAFLLSAGADAALQNNSGKTAYDLAMGSSRFKRTPALLALEAAN